MIKEEKLEHCMGCKQNFYNLKNSYGINECWNLSSAELVLKKKIALTQIPPWKQKPIKVLSCYQQKGYVFWAFDREI